MGPHGTSLQELMLSPDGAFLDIQPRRSAKEGGMKVRRLWWVGVSILVAVTASLIAIGQLRQARDCPIISYPPKLDMGEHEIGDEVLVPFTIGNSGRGMLLVDHIRSNCSCTAMAIEENGQYSELSS